MNFYTYILYSPKLDKYYTGHTDNLESRLGQHNTGISDFTSSAKDWQLKYWEAFPTRKEAFNREKEIKRKKSRKYIIWLIEGKRTGRG